MLAGHCVVTVGQTVGCTEPTVAKATGPYDAALVSSMTEPFWPGSSAETQEAPQARINPIKTYCFQL
jgi:hypothetical protein